MGWQTSNSFGKVHSLWIVMYMSRQLWLQCILPTHWDWVQLMLGDPGERCIPDKPCPLSSFLTTTTHLWTCIHRLFPQVHKVLQVRVLTQTTPHSSSLSRYITSSSLLPMNPCEHQVHHVWKVSHVLKVREHWHSTPHLLSTLNTDMYTLYLCFSFQMSSLYV